MKTRIVRIGNSQGIRIPKLLLEQSGLGEEVELVVEDDVIIVRPARQSRSDWAEAFQAMAKHGDDVLLDPEPMGAEDWDEEEWEW
jgi:antitoxin MazE